MINKIATVRLPATILIVDDEISNRKLLEALLHAERYLTVSAANGEEALSLVERHPPGLVLLDIMMPSMDGYEVARRLKANPVTSSIPIIMVTAKLDREARLAGLKAGAEDFLTFPVDRAELTLRVRNLLRLKELGDFHQNQSAILEREVQARTADLQRFRTAMDATAEGIFLVDRSTMRFVEVNAGACSMLGYPRDELLQQSPSQLLAVPPAQLKREYDSIISGHIRGDLTESFLQRKNGSRFPVELRRSAQRFGDDWIVVGVLLDITQRKQVEQEMQETKNFLASIFDNIPNSIFVKDARNLQFLRVNAACENLTGYSEGELLGKSDYDFFPREEAEFFVAKDREILASKQRVFVVEEAITSRDGTKKLLQTKKLPILDQNGDPRYLLGMSEDITERNRAQEMLRKSEGRFRGFVEQSPDAMIIHQAGKIVFANDAMVELLRADDTSSLLGRTGLSFVHAEHSEIAEHRRARLYAGQTVPLVEQVYTRLDGTSVAVEVAASPIVLEGQPAALVTLRDITARKEQERKIARLNRIHAVLSGINSAIVRIRNRNELFKEACRIIVEQGRFTLGWIAVLDHSTGKLMAVAQGGLPENSGVDSAFFNGSVGLVPAGAAELALREKRAAVDNVIVESPDTPGAQHEWDTIKVRQAAIELGANSVIVLPLVVERETFGILTLYAPEKDFFDDEEIKLLNELAGDISFNLEFIAKGEKVDYLAYYDVVTGLANRSLLLERLAQYMRSAASDGHRLALFLFDLERFQYVNDSLGRPAGDQLLKQVAEWLTLNLGDANLFARVGADQFAIMLPKAVKGGNVSRLVEKSMEAFLKHPFRLDDSVLRIAAKVGIAIFPDDATDADTLFRNAEAALKNAKASGTRYLFYTRTMNERVTEKLTLENRLRQALDKEEFVLHYQPKINLESGKITGAEALIRWNDPQSGLVPPGRFIPILEETGLIYEVGRWALCEAIEDYMRWQIMGLAVVPIAVNVSPLQLRNHGFIAQINQAIGVDERAAAGLELEITESLIMEDVGHNISTLRAIRDMGIKIAIDDFGTGFSSLSYLAKLPVDTLKIDRSFVIDMTAAQEGQALVSSIINLGHSLKLKVVAEGVETEEQLRQLRLLSCDEMQGYLFSKPVPGETFETRFLSAPPKEVRLGPVTET